MYYKISNASTTYQSSNSLNGKSAKAYIPASQLMMLFEEELKTMYWTEQIMISTFSNLVKKATSTALIEALQYHLSEAEEQILRVELVFELLGIKALTKNCKTMEGLISDAEGVVAKSDEGCDEGIISAAKKIQQYKIASYRILRQCAMSLLLTEARSLFEATLDEEKISDEKMSEIKISIGNAPMFEKEMVLAVH